jgi:amidophosphoribosyltransferase
MGIELALQDRDLPPVDLVVPVPDSGVQAAVGYAQQSGSPFDMAIIRSHYVGRTFILPNQDARTDAIHLKLSVCAAAVAGKRVVLVDDSLVRGNTARQLVQMVRDAGAREVWLRLASPPIVMPCYLGIDTPTRRELLINRFRPKDAELDDPLLMAAAIDQVRLFVGADNLRYLSRSGLRRATGQHSFCMGCMDGRYPV